MTTDLLIHSGSIDLDRLPREVVQCHVTSVGYLSRDLKVKTSFTQITS